MQTVDHKASFKDSSPFGAKGDWSSYDGLALPMAKHLKRLLGLQENIVPLSKSRYFTKIYKLY